MSSPAAASQSISKRPRLLVFVIAISVLRALWSLFEMIPLLGYVVSGRVSSPGFIYLSLALSTAWLVISVGLWRLRKWSRMAAIIVAGIGVVLGGRGLVLMMMHRSATLANSALVVVFLVLNFVVIACLSLAAIQTAFNGQGTGGAEVSATK